MTTFNLCQILLTNLEYSLNQFSFPIIVYFNCYLFGYNNHYSTKHQNNLNIQIEFIECT